MLDHIKQANISIEFNSGKEQLSIDRNGATHIKTVIEESIDSPSMHTHILSLNNPHYIDSILGRLSASGYPRITSKINLLSSVGSITQPTQDHVVVGYSSEEKGLGNDSGNNVSLVTSDVRYAMQGSKKTRSLSGKISDIMQSIAEEYGIKYVIEPTQETFNFIQSNQDDYTFIRLKLLPRSRNSKSKGAYMFYVSDNILHYHTIDYNVALHTISYYQENTGSLIRRDLSQEEARRGGSITTITVHNPYSGTSQQVVSKPENAVRLGNVVPNLNPINHNRSLKYHLNTNNPIEINHISNYHYEIARMSSFVLEYTTCRGIVGSIGNMINIIIAPGSKAPSEWSGIYQIFRIRRILENQSLYSTYYLRRGEWQQDSRNSIQIVNQPGNNENIAKGSVAKLTGQDNRNVPNNRRINIINKSGGLVA